MARRSYQCARHKATVVQGFEKHDNESAVLIWSPNSPDLNPSEHLGVCWTDTQRSRQLRGLKGSAADIMVSRYHSTLLFNVGDYCGDNPGLEGPSDH